MPSVMRLGILAYSSLSLLCQLATLSPAQAERTTRILSKSAKKQPTENERLEFLWLINKNPKSALKKDWVPDGLVSLSSKYVGSGRDIQLRKEVASSFARMHAAGRRHGVSLRVISGYRSYETQRRLHRSKLKKYGERAKRISAIAGHSQHQLGTTVDLSTRELHWKATPRFRKTKAARWMRNHAHRYGFAMSYPRGQRAKTGYSYEPWHYRYIGVAAAREMHDQDILLEDYLTRCRAGSAPTSLSCGQRLTSKSSRAGSRLH